MNDKPIISVSGHHGDWTKDIHCSFELNGTRIEVNVPNGVAAGALDDEHARARPILLAAVEALAAALRG